MSADHEGSDPDVPSGNTTDVVIEVLGRRGIIGLEPGEEVSIPPEGDDPIVVRAAEEGDCR